MATVNIFEEFKNQTKATIENIEIYIQNVSLQTGIRLAINEIVNYGRFVNPTGFEEPIKSIEFRVFGRQNKVALEEILKNNPIIEVTLYDFSFKEKFFHNNLVLTEFDENKIGLYAFKLDLIRSDLSIYGKVQKISLRDLKNNSDKSEETLFTKFVNLYKITTNSISTVDSLLTKAIGNINDITATIYAIPNQIIGLQETIKRFQASINTIIAVPAQLGSYLNTILNNFCDVGNTFVDQKNAIVNLLTNNPFKLYDKNSSNISNDLYSGTQPINNYIIATCLNNLIEKIATNEYILKDDLLSDKNNLLNLYNDKIKYIDDIDLINILQNQLNIGLILINEKENNLSAFKEINVGIANPYDVAFIYYDDLNVDKLYNWNLSQEDYTCLEGKIKIIL